MRIRRKMKRTTKQYIIVSLISMITMGTVAIVTAVLITNQLKQEYEQKLGEISREIEENKREVLISSSDITRGEILTSTMVEAMTCYSSEPQDLFITSEDLGKALLIDLPSGTQIMESMVTEHVVASELREVQYDVIHRNSNLLVNDVVDIRIFFPNGEDYTVLSKKMIKPIGETAIESLLWLEEEEIIRMQSAVVDAYLYQGAYLYTSRYIEPNLQEATIVNYEPSVEAIHLIQENPNILLTATNELSKTVRKALENRLSKSLNRDISEPRWKLDSDYIYQDFNRRQKDDDSLEIDLKKTDDDLDNKNQGKANDTEISMQKNMDKSTENPTEIPIERTEVESTQGTKEKVTAEESDIEPELGKLVEPTKYKDKDESIFIITEG